MVDHLPVDPVSQTPAHVVRTAGGTTVRIRPLRSAADGRQCVELQRHVWGWDQADVVPATLLHVVDYVGGLAAGAFDDDGTLLGFVFGISGVRDGHLAHWSHMLGVRETARNIGLGRMLKEYQRDTLAAIGITKIYWSFDPLMAKNAYFNLNRLGANVVDYVPDMYGTTDSPLHFGLATDRLVVCLENGVHPIVPPVLPLHHGLPILSAFPHRTDVPMPAGERGPDKALIEIPADILVIQSRSSAAVEMWRLAVRRHLQWALAHGYTISGVQANAEPGRFFYLIRRGAPDEDADTPSIAPIRAIHVSPA